MDIITNEARSHELINLDKYYPDNDILLFDIETTGFTAETTMLYLIGISYYENGKWIIRQYFNDDGKSELDIIEEFNKLLPNYKYLMHYNGDGFDIPYVSKKLAAYDIQSNFDNTESIDLYKILKPFKNTLHFDNLKQKSIERYLGINRLDKYTGGDLIKVYENYLESDSREKKQLLLQHNYEDLEGLICCGSMLGYKKFKDGEFTVSKMSVRKDKLLFSLKLDYPLPRRITFGDNGLIITAYKNEATLSVPILDCELKFYFDNYKEYYYLPAEDYAVHKSVASYVDRNYRIQAKKETCYTKRKGYFITQLDTGIISGYKRDISEKETFIELADSFLQDLSMINTYAKYIIKELI